MSRPLRALLLAAGLGTRLRPFTLHTPKCLMPIGSEPLLGRWLRQLEAADCESVLINTHYLADQVELFLEQRAPTTMRVQTRYEPELLGTAGTLLTNRSFFEGTTGLLPMELVLGSTSEAKDAWLVLVDQLKAQGAQG